MNKENITGFQKWSIGKTFFDLKKSFFMLRKNYFCHILEILKKIIKNDYIFFKNF